MEFSSLLLPSRPSTVPTAGSSPAFTSPCSRCPWASEAVRRWPSLKLRSLQRANLTWTAHGKREVQRKKSLSPRPSEKGERPPSQLLRRWANVSRHRLLSPRTPSHSCPSELCVGEFKCKHSHEVTLSLPLPSFNNSLIRTAGPCGS